MKAMAVFVAFAVAQISIQLSFASTASPSYAMLVQQQLVVRITTSGNRPILVNSNSTATGGSLATGAIIETPDGVSATIDLGPLGTVDLAPNSKVVLDFDCPPAPPAGTAPAPCKIKVKVVVGCVVLKTKKGTEGQIDTEQQEKVQESKKGATGAPLNFCTPGAGAGASAGAAAAGAAATTAGGIGAGTIAAVVIAGGLLAGGLVFGFSGGGNPSGTAP